MAVKKLGCNLILGVVEMGGFWLTFSVILQQEKNWRIALPPWEIFGQDGHAFEAGKLVYFCKIPFFCVCGGSAFISVQEVLLWVLEWRYLCFSQWNARFSLTWLPGQSPGICFVWARTLRSTPLVWNKSTGQSSWFKKLLWRQLHIVFYLDSLQLWICKLGIFAAQVGA